MIKAYKNIYPKIGKDVYISENASVIGDVRLGGDVSVWFGTVLRGDVNYIEVGAKTNIQDLTMCHVRDEFPLIIGNEVTVGHAAKLHGCKIEDRCIIGIGAIILDGAVVGEGSIVAAGALVPPNSHVALRSIVMGVPAKTKRRVSDKEYEMIKEHFLNYIDYKNEYLGSS